MMMRPNVQSLSADNGFFTFTSNTKKDMFYTVFVRLSVFFSNFTLKKLLIGSS